MNYSTFYYHTTKSSSSSLHPHIDRLNPSIYPDFPMPPRTPSDIATHLHTLYTSLHTQNIIDADKLALQRQRIPQWVDRYTAFDLEIIVLDVMVEYGQLSDATRRARTKELRAVYHGVCST